MSALGVVSDVYGEEKPRSPWNESLPAKNDALARLLMGGASLVGNNALSCPAETMIVRIIWSELLLLEQSTSSARYLDLAAVYARASRVFRRSTENLCAHVHSALFCRFHLAGTP